MTFFGLKQGQDLENPAANPHQEFQGVPPGKKKTKYICSSLNFKGLFSSFQGMYIHLVTFFLHFSFIILTTQELLG